LPKPWSRPLLAFIIFAVLTLGTFVSSHDLTSSTNALSALTFYALLAAATAIDWKRVGPANLDITVLGIAALAWLLATGWTLLFILINADFEPIIIFFFMAVYFVAASTVLVVNLPKLA